jgi:hypothetical protein
MVNDARNDQKEEGRNSLIFVSRTGQELGESSDSHGVNMKMAVSRYAAPCSLVETDRRFRGTVTRLHSATLQKRVNFRPRA